ncbi:MAG: zinc-binding dehydrogenase [Opitutales bacterium]
MKAVLVDPNAPGRLALGEAPKPKPAPHEALVRVETISVNRGEVMFAQNNEPGSRIGWDIAGVVEAPAANGPGPAKGTRVVGWTKNETAWAELAAVPLTELCPLTPGLNPEVACTLPVAGLTALYTLERGERLLGSRVLVTGATGGVGQFAVQLATLMGAEVVAPVRKADAVDGVKALGAVEVPVDTNGEATRALGPYRLIVDGIGGDFLSAILPGLDQDGRAVLYGVSGGLNIAVPVPLMLGSGRGRIEGFTLYRDSEFESSSKGLARLQKLALSGRLQTPIAVRESWDKVGEIAQGLLDRSYTGKAVLHVGG